MPVATPQPMSVPDHIIALRRWSQDAMEVGRKHLATAAQPRTGLRTWLREQLGLKRPEYLGSHALRTCLMSAFANYAHIALMQWRLELSPPAAALNSALEVARLAADHLPAVLAEWHAAVRNAPAGSGKGPCSVKLFDFPSATYISILVAGQPDPQPDPKFLPYLATEADWAHRESQYYLHFCNSIALNHLLDARPWRNEEQVAVKGQRSPYLRLASRTCREYVSLIKLLPSASIESIDEQVKVLEALYIRRRRSSYYSGGYEYFGGYDGENAVDFQLAAILKYGLRNRPEIYARIDSVHKWRW